MVSYRIGIHVNTQYRIESPLPGIAHLEHIGLLHVRILCHVVKYNAEHNRRVLLAMLA